MLNPLLKLIFFFTEGLIGVSIGFSPIYFIFSLFYFDDFKEILNHSFIAIIIFIVSNVFYSICIKTKEKLNL